MSSTTSSASSAIAGHELGVDSRGVELPELVQKVNGRVNAHLVTGVADHHQGLEGWRSSLLRQEDQPDVVSLFGARDERGECLLVGGLQ